MTTSKNPGVWTEIGSVAIPYVAAAPRKPFPTDALMNVAVRLIAPERQARARGIKLTALLTVSMVCSKRIATQTIDWLLLPTICMVTMSSAKGAACEILKLYGVMEFERTI